MTTKEIRDRLILEKAEYQNALKAVNTAAVKIKEIIQNLSDEDSEALARYNMSIDAVKQIDVERCKIDKEYLEQCKQVTSECIEKLHSFLEEQFNV